MNEAPVQRILMTADPIGGVWTYALELTAVLNRAGKEVILATMGRSLTEAQRREAAEVPSLRLRESCFKLEWMEDPWEDVAEAGRWLLGLEETFQPDIIHLNGYAHAALPWQTPVIVAAHSCVLSWWAAVKGEPAPELWERYRRAVQAGLAAADSIVAPSRWAASNIKEIYGIPEVRVIPNGRNPAGFRSGIKNAFVFSAGRLWDEAKNVAALERVAPALAWPVYVAGEANMPGRPATALDNLLFLGNLDAAALGEWLARAPIFALPARYEPFGLTILEAALAGCALVLGDIPSLRENWDDAAWFVGPDDDKALESALSRLIEDSAAREQLAARSRKRAIEFTPERMAGAYLELYSEMACRGVLCKEAN